MFEDYSPQISYNTFSCLFQYGTWINRAILCCDIGASQVALVVKNPPANAEDIRNAGSMPGTGRSPGGGHVNSLQYSCLENFMDSEAWQATVHGVSQSDMTEAT